MRTTANNCPGNYCLFVSGRRWRFHFDPVVGVAAAPDQLIALFGDKWKLAFVEKENPQLTMEPLVAD